MRSAEYLVAVANGVLRLSAKSSFGADLPFQGYGLALHDWPGGYAMFVCQAAFGPTLTRRAQLTIALPHPERMTGDEKRGERRNEGFFIGRPV